MLETQCEHSSQLMTRVVPSPDTGVTQLDRPKHESNLAAYSPEINH